MLQLQASLRKPRSVLWEENFESLVKEYICVMCMGGNKI